METQSVVAVKRQNKYICLIFERKKYKEVALEN